MDQELINNLRENFMDRVCTVLTQPVSFPFKDGIEYSEYFTGKVVDINLYGVWVQHLRLDTYAFFTFPIVGIIEEQVIPDEDPRAQKIREELKQKESPKPATPNNFIPIDSLTKMVKRS